jgi:SAM-dependent methyltransferase
LSTKQTLPPAYFTRYDEHDDRLFYQYPRLTVHIDEPAIVALGQLFHETLPPQGVFLDLMSSYRSHLPPELPVQRLVGLGLNAVEMRQNSQLDIFVVHDLNQTPTLPFAPASFDGVVCSISVQYLTRPLEVFAEVGRILQPGAPFVVSFSNRCFPSKAVRIWMLTSEVQRLRLVQTYFARAGCFVNIKAMNRSPRRWIGDPLYVVVGWRAPNVL